jgi:ribose transport system substrate-binding protein/inositol transport system substrate-binding protein
MAKKLTKLVTLAAAAALLLTGCAEGGGAGETGGASDGKIALIMSHMTNEFTTTVASAAEAKGEELGYEVTVFDSGQDASTQVSQIEQAVSQGYDGILVEPVSTDGVVPGLSAANEAGVPIATIVQKASQQDLAAAYIGGDEVAAGKLQMEQAIEAIGGEGKIAVLYGPMGSDAQIARNDGYEQALADYPDVEVVFDKTANWVTAEALTLVENWFSTGTEIDAIVAQNDVQVFGIDATSDGIDSINADGMVGTVSQDTAGIGELGVETMVQLIDGEEVEAEVLTEAVWITKENVDTLSE